MFSSVIVFCHNPFGNFYISRFGEPFTKNVGIVISSVLEGILKTSFTHVAYGLNNKKYTFKTLNNNTHHHLDVFILLVIFLSCS